MILRRRSRITLTVDPQKRMSDGSLGFEEGHVVADPLPDGSGWVVRPAQVLTEAEIDILGSSENVENIERRLDDLRQGKLTDRHRS